jgi:hypothetical protein
MFFRGYVICTAFPTDTDLNNIPLEEDITLISSLMEPSSSTSTRSKKGKISALVIALVIDGIEKRHFDKVDFRFSYGDRLNYVKLISSEQTLVDAGRLRSDAGKLISKTFGFADYVTWCEDGIFFNSVREQLGGVLPSPLRNFTSAEKRKILRHKYFFAGLNPRFMFEFSIPDVKKQIAMQFRKVHSYNLARLTIEDGALNQLIRQANPTTQFVSEFVARQLDVVFSQHLFELLHQSPFTKNNPCMDGWACEGDFLFSVRNDSFCNDRVYDVDFANGIKTVGSYNLS